MAEKGEKVIVKSGGPEMLITYVLKGGEGSREKAARMKGFKKGDIVCQYQTENPDGSTRKITSTFKAVCLKYPDGSFVAVQGDGGDDDDDDDDW